jgi:hypothetical protein
MHELFIGGADKYQKILTLKFNYAGSLGKMASGRSGFVASFRGKKPSKPTP